MLIFWPVQNTFSSFLKTLVQRIKKDNVFLIPSAASSSLFYFDEKKRFMKRKELQINAEDLVFVYSGSLKRYQMFDETIRFFRYLFGYTYDFFSYMYSFFEKEDKIKMIEDKKYTDI